MDRVHISPSPSLSRAHTGGLAVGIGTGSTPISFSSSRICGSGEEAGGRVCGPRDASGQTREDPRHAPLHDILSLTHLTAPLLSSNRRRLQTHPHVSKGAHDGSPSPTQHCRP